MFKQLILPIIGIITSAIFYLFLYALFLEVTGLQDPGGSISVFVGIVISFFAIVTGMGILEYFN